MHRVVYRFGRFELDSKFRELRGGGEKVAIAPKSLECLLYLIGHRDRAVGRDELISAVWGRLDVSDHLLGQTLRGARLALGDTGTERTTIATVPRFGYRWLAAVEEVTLDLPVPERTAAGDPAGDAGAAAAPPAAVEPGVPAGRLEPRAPRRRLWFGLAVLVLLAMSLYALRPVSPPPATVAAAAHDGGDTYLVLPAAIAGGDVENAWLRLGGMEYVASRLRQEAGLRVLSSNQAMAVVSDDRSSASRSASDVHRIRSITGASYLLMPRAARLGNAWTFELDVYHRDDLRTYSGTGARPLDAAAEASRRFLAAQGIEVSAKIDPQPGFTELLQRVDAAFLKGELGRARELIEAAPAEQGARPELRIREARVAFRGGRLEQAEALFKTLSADTPDAADGIRARAYSGLGSVALRRGGFAEGERAQSYAIELLEKNGPRDLLGTAYMERGMLAGSLAKYEAAMSDFGRARIEMERNGDTLALGALDFNVGLVEAYRNRYDAALAAMNRAIEVSQRYGVADMLASSLLGKTIVQLEMLDHAAALATTQRFVELQSQLENPILRRRLASARVRALTGTARLSEAASELDAYLKTLPSARGDPQFDLLRRQIAYRSGDFAAVGKDGEAMLERIRQRSDPTSEASYREAARLFASAAARAGDAAAGRRWLDALGKNSGSTGDESWEDTYSLALARAELTSPTAADEADRDFTRALALADQHGRNDLVVESGLAQIRCLLAEGRGIDRATALAGRLAGFADRDYRVALATAAAYRASGDHALAAAANAKAVAALGEQATPLPY